MATITETQTLETEFTMGKTAINLMAQRKNVMHPITKMLKPKQPTPIECNIPDCSCKMECPPDCSCKQETSSYRAVSIIINAFGILLAIFATYMIISTDSKLYLVFWIGYSILRRMMIKSKKHFKSD